MKNLIIKIHQKALSNPTFVRAFHTFWQTFVGTFLVGISGVINSSDAKTAVLALVASAVASAFSAVKSQTWPVVVGWASRGSQ